MCLASTSLATVMTNVRAEDPVASWQQPYYTLARNATGPLSVSAAKTVHDLLVRLFPTQATIQELGSGPGTAVSAPLSASSVHRYPPLGTAYSTIQETTMNTSLA